MLCTKKKPFSILENLKEHQRTSVKQKQIIVFADLSLIDMLITDQTSPAAFQKLLDKYQIELKIANAT